MGAAALPILGRSVIGAAETKNQRPMKMIKPKRLALGDTVGVIAPSSGVSAEAFDKALASLAGLGFKTKVGKFAQGSSGFLSGTDKERLHDLHWAFSDADVDAVWCVRGGSGAPRLLPNVDYPLIKKNPKIFVGFSDITALHLAINQTTGLVTFHGPVGTSEFSDYTRTHVLNTLTKPTAHYKIGVSENAQAPTVIVPGKCRGRLTGGNLSLIGALAGTPYALRDLEGKILFIEDINEPPYKVDRLLTHLRQSTDRKRVAGIALGTFTNGGPLSDAPSTSLLSVLKDRLGDLGVPVVYGLSFGHIRDNCTLPLGIEAEVDASNATITLLETAVK